MTPQIQRYAVAKTTVHHSASQAVIGVTFSSESNFITLTEQDSGKSISFPYPMAGGLAEALKAIVPQ